MLTDNCFHSTLDGGYSEWSDWGTCDRSCGGGAQVRTRICNRPVPSGGGKRCHALGPAIQVKRCNRKGCPGTVLYKKSIKVLSDMPVRRENLPIANNQFIPTSNIQHCIP